MKANKGQTKATKSGKNAKSAKNASKASGKSESVQALKLELDVKQNHSMRQSLADSKNVDLFALHSLKRASRAYIALCAENAQRVIGATNGKEATHVLIAGAVGNKITLLGDGFYSRGHGKSALVGHVDSLRKLYGNRVDVFAVSELEARFGAVKEDSVRRFGTSKQNARTLTGREIATDGDHFVFLVRLDNGKLAIHNGEFSRNAHQNEMVRASTVRQTEAKS